MTLRLYGASSGYMDIDAPATGSNVTLELPTDSIKPGLVLLANQVFGAVSSVTVTNCFTSTYDNYRIMLSSALSAADTNITMQLITAGSTYTGSQYITQYLQASATTVTAAVATGGATTSWAVATGGSGYQNNASIDVFDPMVARATSFNAISFETTGTPTYYVGVRGGVMQNGDLHTGFVLTPATGTFGLGRIRVYGYRNSL